MTDPERFDAEAYWAQRLSARYDLAAVGQKGLPLSYNRWMYRVRRRVFARVLRRRVPDVRFARVLDVGSGTGFYIELWKAAGAREVAAMDVALPAVEALRRTFPDVRVHHASIADPGATAGLEAGFDVVTAMDVMFHIVDDRAFRRAVANIHSVLRDGGLYIFSDNFLHSPEKRRRHIVHRRLEDVLRVLDAVGFDVLERRPMLFLMTAPLDSGSRHLLRAWSLISRAASRGEAMGWITGALLYPIELLLTGLRSESPTTEVMVCRKRGLSDRTKRERHAIEPQ